jgi:hypothetical protein
VTILLTLRNRGRRAESLLSDNYVDPMKLSAKGRISLEWQLCWPSETEGEGQNLSWETIMFTLWSWGKSAESLLSDDNADPMKLRVKDMVSLIWVTIMFTLRNGGWRAFRKRTGKGTGRLW